MYAMQLDVTKAISIAKAIPIARGTPLGIVLAIGIAVAIAIAFGSDGGPEGTPRNLPLLGGTSPF